ncbi:GNAT family N-acetyltransferase [Flammeovirga sp. SJP92]|uniref:GNAT family N-acetyltransferase n=1 Tax=Flammeovirga sp. SJP92 TaxID=1775430 RepID=UPI000787E357|nr:GNAT family N-acetyltransferase [Flammeovirga sp. SJP92]KXX70931.1 hypothetical protein AVL50_11215 [Flammeovirga sp. SJP92]
MIIRESKSFDRDAILKLYTNVAQYRKGIARGPHEISESYVKNFMKSCSTENGGLHLLGFDDNQLIAEIHAQKYGIEIFDHVLTGITVVVHDKYQGKGYGKKIFEHFLQFIENHRPDICRVELEARSSNNKSIQLYESIGFQKEGIMKLKTRNFDGIFEDSIMFSWFNKNFDENLYSASIELKY